MGRTVYVKARVMEIRALIIGRPCQGIFPIPQKLADRSTILRDGERNLWHAWPAEIHASMRKD